MITCPDCGFESPDDFRFCPKCATSLAAPLALPEERKVVTTLFCDLVAFTAMSEAADPEDVDRVLSEYFARATKVIESHGGAVEKFIGDAVVGVFGVPAVHEDDPERAVRAALRTLEALEGLQRPDGSPLEARCGVNTGAALVRLDVDPASGRGFLIGDAVNVAARLEAAAPPGGVVVGALTHELTERVILYQELPPVNAKGKTHPLLIWRALAPRSRTGLRTAGRTATPFLGRDADLLGLEESLEAARSTGVAQFTLLVGEPGIGKSRLVLEFARSLEERHELITWRQGRCLSFGKAVAFAALSEIVKAQAGVFDDDDQETVQTKLDGALPEDEDREWLRQRLRPLLGLEASQASRKETFAAWTRFLTHVASSGPAVLVLEDLHWADEGTLAFLEHLAAQKLAVPLFVLLTTRPELLAQHSGSLSQGETVCLRILTPLSRKEAKRLVGALFTDRLAAEVRGPILEHVGGNPLYAEEYARLLLDKDLLQRTKGALRLKEGAELPLPDTIQAVLAARLDTLPREHKAVLCDAAVYGDTFWSGGVAALGERSKGAVEQVMAALMERQLARRTVSSTLCDEGEYVFWHSLVRDVAYGELPRRSRMHKHKAAVDWLKSQAIDHLDDVAESLAYHSMTALGLAQSTGDQSSSTALLDDVVRFSTLAGDRAMGIDVPAAEQHYVSALALVPDDARERWRLLVRWGRALLMTGRLGEASDALEQGIDGLLAAGDVRAAAVAMRTWAVVLFHLDDPRHEEIINAAVALLEREEPTQELITVLVGLVGERAMAEDHLGTLRAAERAIDLSVQLGTQVPVEALGFLGGARCDLGDAGGIDDCRRALVAAEAQGLALEAANISCNLGVSVFGLDGPRAALEIHREGLDSARRRGMGFLVRAFRMQVLDDLVWVGEWDQASAEAMDLAQELELEANEFDLMLVWGQQVMVHWWRDEFPVTPLADALAEHLAGTDQPVLAAVGLVPTAAVLLTGGRSRAARDLLITCEAVPHIKGCSDYVCRLPEAVRVALAAGDAHLAEMLVDGVEPSRPLHEQALASARSLLDEARGRLEEAAAAGAAVAYAWRRFGVPYEEAQALLGHGRCLVALERMQEATRPLEQAREILQRLGARSALAETGKWLAKTN
jgi:class 3 adenylate cyclase